MQTYESAWSYFKKILWDLNPVKIKISECYKVKQIRKDFMSLSEHSGGHLILMRIHNESSWLLIPFTMCVEFIT